MSVAVSDRWWLEGLTPKGMSLDPRRRWYAKLILTYVTLSVVAIIGRRSHEATDSDIT